MNTYNLGLFSCTWDRVCAKYRRCVVMCRVPEVDVGLSGLRKRSAGSPGMHADPRAPEWPLLPSRKRDQRSSSLHHLRPLPSRPDETRWVDVLHSTVISSKISRLAIDTPISCSSSKSLRDLLRSSQGHVDGLECSRIAFGQTDIMVSHLEPLESADSRKFY